MLVFLSSALFRETSTFATKATLSVTAVFDVGKKTFAGFRVCQPSGTSMGSFYAALPACLPAPKSPGVSQGFTLLRIYALARIARFITGPVRTDGAYAWAVTRHDWT
jgi:hypothetical protein